MFVLTLKKCYHGRNLFRGIDVAEVGSIFSRILNLVKARLKPRKNANNTADNTDSTDLEERVGRLEVTTIAMLQLQLQQLGGSAKILKGCGKPKIVLVKDDKNEAVSEDFLSLGPNKETTYH